MLIVVTVWWLLFFTALGLCLGSFLNVVIFRLPRGLSVSNPVWSFCPHCHNRIAWYDNLPVIGFLRLRGRCRNCWSTISVRYPFFELMTAIVVVILLDAFLIGQVRNGVFHGTDLNWCLAEDWPILLAHIILFACLLAMSAIDLEYYWIDIRFTHFAAAAGILLHALWTPRHSRDWPQPFESTAAITIVMFIAFCATWLILHRLAKPVDDESEPADESNGEWVDTISAEGANGRAILWAPIVLLLLLLVGSVDEAMNGGAFLPFYFRAGAVVLLFMIVVIREAAHVRESDHEIIETIETEAPLSRRRTFVELGALAPAIVLGVATYVVIDRAPGSTTMVGSVLHWAPFAGEWQPVWGVGMAVSGYIIGAAIGWTVRIVFNLAFGKEAFATGDIHMMAAAGAVAGWQVVLLGFIMTCFLAIVGWIAVLPFKRSRAIPLGPWLTMGLMVTTVFYEPLVSSPLVRNVTGLAEMLFVDNSQHRAMNVIP